MSGEEMLTEEEVAQARERRLVGEHLQFMAGNPLTAEESAMFEMFERERWSYARRLAYLLRRAEETARRYKQY